MQEVVDLVEGIGGGKGVEGSGKSFLKRSDILFGCLVEQAHDLCGVIRNGHAGESRDCCVVGRRIGDEVEDPAGGTGQSSRTGEGDEFRVGRARERFTEFAPDVSVVGGKGLAGLFGERALGLDQGQQVSEIVVSADLPGRGDGRFPEFTGFAEAPVDQVLQRGEFVPADPVEDIGPGIAEFLEILGDHGDDGRRSHEFIGIAEDGVGVFAVSALEGAQEGLSNLFRLGAHQREGSFAHLVRHAALEKFLGFLDGGQDIGNDLGNGAEHAAERIEELLVGLVRAGTGGFREPFKHFRFRSGMGGIGDIFDQAGQGVFHQIVGGPCGGRLEHSGENFDGLRG